MYQFNSINIEEIKFIEDWIHIENIATYKYHATFLKEKLDNENEDPCYVENFQNLNNSTCLGKLIDNEQNCDIHVSNTSELKYCVTKTRVGRFAPEESFFGKNGKVYKIINSNFLIKSGKKIDKTNKSKNNYVALFL